jgi:hypothetical protein
VSAVVTQIACFSVKNSDEIFLKGEVTKISNQKLWKDGGQVSPSFCCQDQGVGTWGGVVVDAVKHASFYISLFL